VPLTIAMIKRSRIQDDQVFYEGAPLTYVTLVCRVDGLRRVDQKIVFAVNDDTGVLEVTAYGSGSKEPYYMSEVDTNESQYYRFVLVLRAFKNSIMSQVHNVTLARDSNQLTHHLINVIVQRTKRALL
jgi:hypothetical protein